MIGSCKAELYQENMPENKELEKPKEYDCFSKWGQWCVDTTGSDVAAMFKFYKEMTDLDHSQQEIAEMWQEFRLG
jgi:hypothetical protein